MAPGKAVLGHAFDGGWWVIGPAGADPAAVSHGVASRTPFTGAHQERRFRSLGVAVQLVPRLRDVDMVADLAAMAAEAPRTRTAQMAAAPGHGRRAAAVVA